MYDAMTELRSQVLKLRLATVLAFIEAVATVECSRIAATKPLSGFLPQFAR
jgi:hypothetical protein